MIFLRYTAKVRIEKEALTLAAAICGVVGSEKQEKMGAGRRTMSPPSI
jgi:hypothetical protein